MATRPPQRSFVVRSGRITRSQKNALQNYRDRYLFDPLTVAIEQAFPVMQPLILEIGFGTGQPLISMAASQPERNFIGIEVYLPGLGRVCREARQLGLQNLRLIQADACNVLSLMKPSMLHQVLLLFPDPWPKKKHHKRRIVQRDFVCQIHRLLEPHGVWHVVTDWQDYARHILTTVSCCDGFQPAGREASVYGQRLPTHFEQRGLKLGHNIHEFIFRKKDAGEWALWDA